MKFLEGTTRADLNTAYLHWRSSTDDSGEHQRFGQWFWNEYGLADQSWSEFFYEEDADKAYMLAFYELPEAFGRMDGGG